MTTRKHTGTSTGAASGATTDSNDILTMPIADLTARVTELETEIKGISARLGGLLSLTADDRKHSHGRFRSGEAEALLGVLDVADANPALFKSLAAEDNGNDPKVFEVPLLRDRLQRIAALQLLLDQLEPLTQELHDTLLALGNLTKPVMLTAYNLARPHAAHDPKLKTLLAKAIDFFAEIAKHSAAARASHAAASAQSSTKSGK